MIMYTCFFEKIVGTLCLDVKVPIEDIYGNISIHHAGDLTLIDSIKVFPGRYGYYSMELPENYPGLFPQPCDL